MSIGELQLIVNDQLSQTEGQRMGILGSNFPEMSITI